MTHSLSLLIAGFILAFTSPAQSEVPATVKAVSLEVHVVLDSTPQNTTLKAKIRATYQLQNTTKLHDSDPRIIPAMLPTKWGTFHGRQPRIPDDKPWCRVLVNGQPVETETKFLIDPESYATGRRVENPIEFLNDPASYPSDRLEDPQKAAWTDRVNNWIADGAELSMMIDRYRALLELRNTSREISGEFEKRVKPYLHDSDELASAAKSVAQGGARFSQIVELLLEIDPAFVIEGQPLLDPEKEYDYRAYEQEWREKVAQWLRSKPELAELLPNMQEVWKAYRESKNLIEDQIPRHLHDVKKLNLRTTLEMTKYLERSSQAASSSPGFLLLHDTSPSRSLLASLFADLSEQFEAEDQAETKLHARWGFDEASISPFTGKLYRKKAGQTSSWDPWRDDTVLEALGHPRSHSLRRSYRQPSSGVSFPVLVSFAAPLEANESATVTLEFEYELGTLQRRPDSSGGPGPRPEFAVVVPPPGGVLVTVTCPTEIQPVIAPAPHSIKSLKDGFRQFEVQLDKGETMLHMIAVETGWGKPFLRRFEQPDERTEQNLRVLIEKIENPTIRPLLMTALYSVLLDRQKLWDAHELALRIAREYPDYRPNLESMQAEGELLEQARLLHDWVLAKGKSPVIQSEEDFDLFPNPNWYDSETMSFTALNALARRVQSLDDEKLTFQERLGKRFILCQAGIDTQSNLNEILKLAESHPDSVMESLEVIQHLRIEDKSILLPYLLNQVDLIPPNLATKGRTSLSRQQQHHETAVYQALSTFRSPQSATRLIQEIKTSRESLVIGAAMSAWSRASFPDQFDALVSIADLVANSPAGRFGEYARLLLRSDINLEKGFAVLDSLRNKYPQFARGIMLVLSEAGYREELPNALAIYQDSTDVDSELRIAIETINNLATPADLAKIEYRHGLPEWVNGELLEIIQRRGGDPGLFPFLEAFYVEHIRKKITQYRSEWIDAVVKVNDPRAIPLLWEIVPKTGRTSEAASALGLLKFPRSYRRQYREDPFDDALWQIVDPDIDAEERESAWKILLADPEASFERALQSGYLSEALNDPVYPLSTGERKLLSFIARFGDVAARMLLRESEGCSLLKRYCIAELLNLLPEETRAIIVANAEDGSLDKDRRLTAKLAVELRNSDGSADR